jgi:hypothetical protein
MLRHEHLSGQNQCQAGDSKMCEELHAPTLLSCARAEQLACGSVIRRRTDWHIQQHSGITSLCSTSGALQHTQPGAILPTAMASGPMAPITAPKPRRDGSKQTKLPPQQQQHSSSSSSSSSSVGVVHPCIIMLHHQCAR